MTLHDLKVAGGHLIAVCKRCLHRAEVKPDDVIPPLGWDFPLFVLGLATDLTLFYATAGWAFGHVEVKKAVGGLPFGVLRRYRCFARRVKTARAQRPCMSSSSSSSLR
jgi:hypothetical protein